MSKIFKIVFSIFFSLQIFSQAIIKVRVSDFPPNYYINEKGQWSGISVELAAAVIETAGLTPQFVEQPWSRAIANLKSGTIHYMANLSKTDDRSDFLYWIGPLRTEKMSLIVLNKNIKMKINDLDDLIKASRQYDTPFAYQADIFYSKAFKDKLENNTQFKKSFNQYYEIDIVLKMILHERILGFFESYQSMQYVINTNPRYKSLAVHPFTLRESPIYHGISKTGVDEAVLVKLQQSFQLCRKNGTISKILEKWNVKY